MPETKRIITLPDRFRDQYHFEDVINQRKEILLEADCLDCSNMMFIEPYSMLGLLLIGREYLRQKGEKLKLKNIPINIYQYLMRMDFFKTEIFQVDENLDQTLFLKRNPESNRLIEIIEIPVNVKDSIEVISEVINIFRKRAKNVLKTWMTIPVVDYFVTVISELCQNIFEHSLDSGYVAMQTYSSGRENFVRLVISDSGVGVVGSFDNKKEVKYKSPAELIELVLTTPLSSKRDFGHGLCQVNSIVEKLKGTVFIRSGNASVTAIYNKKKQGSSYIFSNNDLQNYNGTQVLISLQDSFGRP